MAGRQLKTTGRLTASSILEVVISMVVIVVVFSIAMGIFANVQRLTLSAKKIRAQGVLREVLFKAEQSPDIDKQNLKVDEWNVEQEISVYGDNRSLHQISLVAYDANMEKVAELKEVVYDAR